MVIPSKNAKAETATAAVTTDDISAGQAVANRFCPRCGSEWQSHWKACPKCVCGGSGNKSGSLWSGTKYLQQALILYFLIMAVTGIGLLSAARPGQRVELVLILEAADSVIILFAVALFRKKVLPSLTRPAPLWVYALVPVAAVVMFATATTLLYCERRFLGVRSFNLDHRFLANGYGWTTIILAVCVQPAIFEELAFRGIVLPCLQTVLSTRDAVLVSALLFMTIHLSAPGIPYLFLVGLVLGYARVRTGTIVPGMLLHFLYNLLCVLPLHLGGIIK